MQPNAQMSELPDQRYSSGRDARLERAAVVQQLRADILGRADERVGPIPRIPRRLRRTGPRPHIRQHGDGRRHERGLAEDLGGPVVSDLDPHVAVEEDVLRLEIAMDDAAAVNMLEPGQDLGGVEASADRVERAEATDPRQQLALAGELEDEEEAVVAGERPEEPDHAGVAIEDVQRRLLGRDRLLLLLAHDLPLVEDLERILAMRRVLVAGVVNLRRQ